MIIMIKFIYSRLSSFYKIVIFNRSRRLYKIKKKLYFFNVFFRKHAQFFSFLS